MWNLTSPVTGGAQTGFTTPTYTVAAGVAPDTNGKQSVVTATGGTQVGVTLHTVSSPFLCNWVQPKAFKTLGQVNPVTGKLSNVPMNVWKFHAIKGLTPLAGQAIKNGRITVTVEIPAGADVADPANIRAMFSLAIGALNQQSAGFGDSAIQGY